MKTVEKLQSFENTISFLSDLTNNERNIEVIKIGCTNRRNK